MQFLQECKTAEHEKYKSLYATHKTLSMLCWMV